MTEDTPPTERKRLPNGRFPSRGPAQSRGPGWGGPASGIPASRITDSERARALQALSKDPAHRAEKLRLAAEMLAIKVRLAHEAEHEAVRLSAAEKVSERLLGKPTVGAPGADGEQVTEVRYRWADEGESAG